MARQVALRYAIERWVEFVVVRKFSGGLWAFAFRKSVNRSLTEGVTATNCPNVSSNSVVLLNVAVLTLFPAT